MPESYEFVSVGDNCIDRFQDGDRLSLVGGNAVNVAAQLSLLGHRVGYFGAVGDDEDGRTTLQALKEVGVCTKHVHVTGMMTAYSLVRHDQKGDRDIYFEEFGASGAYMPTDEEVEIMRRSHHAHIGWIRDGSTLNLRLASNETSVSRDLSVNSSPVDLKPNGLSIAVRSASSEQEAREVAINLTQSDVGLAIVTMGAQGSLAFDGAETTRLNANVIDAVDTTGAGDAFIAGFLSRYKQGGNIRAALENARHVATKACLHVGGFPQ